MYFSYFSRSQVSAARVSSLLRSYAINRTPNIASPRFTAPFSSLSSSYARSRPVALAPLPRSTGIRFFSSTPAAAASSVPAPASAPLTATDIPVPSTTMVESLSALSTARGSIETSWPNIKMIEQALEYVHDYTGLPWWSSIILFTVGIRALLIPVSIYTQKNAARMVLAAPEIKELQAQSMNDTSLDSMTRMKKFRSGVKAIYAKYDCKPSRAMLPPFVMAPIFISMFWVIKRMGEVHPDWALGGPAAPFSMPWAANPTSWLTDLGAADSTLILPIINAAGMIFGFKLASESADQPAAQKRIMQIGISAIAVISVLASSQFPMGLYYYWITTSVWTMLQGIVLRSPSVKKMLGIPVVPKKIKDESEALSTGAVVPPPAVGSTEWMKVVDESKARSVKMQEEAMGADPKLKEKLSGSQPVVKPTVVYSVNPKKNKNKNAGNQ